MKTLHLFFSHTLTPDQETDARVSLQADDFRALPPDLQQLFSNVPPDLPDLSEYAAPLFAWLSTQAQVGDLVLVQGDFGLVYLLVNHCKQLGLVPVYATTERQSVEVPQSDGSIITQRVFRHKMFRRY